MMSRTSVFVFWTRTLAGNCTNVSSTLATTAAIDGVPGTLRGSKVCHIHADNHRLFRCQPFHSLGLEHVIDSTKLRV